MKLYHKVNRFRFLRAVPKRYHPHLRWGLSLKPGDVINDCSGFNVRIVEADEIVYFTRKGWFIYDVRYTTSPFGGSCSLMNCGVEPALSVPKIMDKFDKFYRGWDNTGGWNFGTEKDPIWVRLQKGLPICDDEGFRHPDLVEEIRLK